METSVGECLNSEKLKDLSIEMPERRRFVLKENKKIKKEKENGLNEKPSIEIEGNKKGNWKP